MRWQGVFVSVLLTALSPTAANAQAVVSTHAGVLNFTEGEVFLDDQPVQQKAGIFSSIKEGSILRTGVGRAEVLLTSGVFFRIDEQSSFRMLSTDLSRPRLEVLSGSAIIDSNDAAGANPLVVVFKAYDLRFLKPGVYRLDSEPGVFETYTGEAELSTKGEPAKKIDESHQFFFGIGTETKKYGDGAVDDFSEWARNRATTITAENQTAAQSTADPGNSAGDPGDYGALYGTPGAGMPSFGGISPSYGTYAGPMLFDNGFYSAPPFFNSFFQPVAVFYLVPWWWRKPPVKASPAQPPNGTSSHGVVSSGGTLTARKLGYPTLPSSGLNSFRPAGDQPYLPRYGTLSPLGIRTLYPSHGLSYGYSPMRPLSPVRIATPPRLSVGSPRTYAPHVYAPVAAPHVSAPVGIHR